MIPFESVAPSPVSTSDIVRFLRAVGDEARLLIVQALTYSDLRAGELSAIALLPSNALAFHLKRLSAVGLLLRRQSAADGRDVYYHLDMSRLLALYAATGDALYPTLRGLPDYSDGSERGAPMSSPEAAHARVSRPLRVLFLCTHNSARSQMAEALLRQMGGDQVEAFSAGSQPTEVHPDAIAALRESGIPTDSLYAKPLDQFLGERFDYIITVCDRVRDICPSFPADPAQAHWSIADPAVIEDADQRAKVFRDTLVELQTRLRYLFLLPHPHTGERFRPPTH